MNDAPMKPPVIEKLKTHHATLASILSLVPGLFCLGAAVIWGFWKPALFANAWLVGYMFVFTVCAGCFFWVLVHHAVDAAWSVVPRRILEVAASLFFPWLALAWIPLAFMGNDLYEWWPYVFEGKTPSYVFAHKAAYFHPWFLAGRSAVYLAFFGFLPWKLASLSVRQDDNGDPMHSIRMRRYSYGGLVLFAICLTFASFDWLMSLDYRWFSTIWGVYIFAACAVSSLAFSILVANALRWAGYLKETLSKEHNHIMGKLLFAFTIFWGYIAFSQYMLIYYGNIPEEQIFFMRRNEGVWHWASCFLAFGHFFFPFLALLTQSAKKNPFRLCAVAAWILFMHGVDLFWIVMPEYERLRIAAGLWEGKPGFEVLPMTLLVVAGFSLLALFVFVKRLSINSLFPVKDPRLYESITLKN
jgi:hypothetical protein